MTAAPRSLKSVSYFSVGRDGSGQNVRGGLFKLLPDGFYFATGVVAHGPYDDAATALAAARRWVELGI